MILLASSRNREARNLRMPEEAISEPRCPPYGVVVTPARPVTKASRRLCSALSDALGQGVMEQFFIALCVVVEAHLICNVSESAPDAGFASVFQG